MTTNLRILLAAVALVVVLTGAAHVTDSGAQPVEATPGTVTDFFATAEARGCFLPTPTSAPDVTPEPHAVALGPVIYPLPTCH